MFKNLPYVYAGPIGCGKTYDLMEACQTADGVLVTVNVEGATLMAHSLGYDFPIVTPQEAAQLGDAYLPIFVDDAEEVLAELLMSSISSIAINGHFRLTEGQKMASRD